MKNNSLQFLLILLPLLSACGSKPSSKPVLEHSGMKLQYPITLELTEAILNPESEILLSDLMDSISYIPLETRDECMIGNAAFYRFTPDYIAYTDLLFDWSGKFWQKLGKQGQGPGEDPAQVLRFFSIGGMLYTNGYKIIEYDLNGAVTGKELLKAGKIEDFSGEQIAKEIYSPYFNCVFTGASTDQIFYYLFPDSLYVLNNQFECVATHTLLPGDFSGYMSGYLSADRPTQAYTTRWENGVLFYNSFQDTVFYVEDTLFTPRWILEYDEVQQPIAGLHTFEKSLGQAADDFFAGKSLSNNPLAEMFDGKYVIESVNETDRFLLLIAIERMFFSAYRRELKGKKANLVFVAYDKQTGELRSARSIKDDLTGFEGYMPRLGVVDNKLMSSFWPHEKAEWLKEQAAVNPQLAQFKERDFLEDNPIMIVGHLKR